MITNEDIHWGVTQLIGKVERLERIIEHSGKIIDPAYCGGEENFEWLVTHYKENTDKALKDLRDKCQTNKTQ